jgi:NTP pyrophosphatase (non-canonical NTP hydrolase)
MLDTKSIRKEFGYEAEECPDIIDFVDAIEALCDEVDSLRDLRPILKSAMAETNRARTLHPSPEHLTLALAEEAGEVTKAVLDFKAGKGTLAHVGTELIQTMAMCIRLYEEGDPTVCLPSVEKP